MLLVCKYRRIRHTAVCSMPTKRGKLQGANSQCQKIAGYRPLWIEDRRIRDMRAHVVVASEIAPCEDRCWRTHPNRVLFLEFLASRRSALRPGRLYEISRRERVSYVSRCQGGGKKKKKKRGGFLTSPVPPPVEICGQLHQHPCAVATILH